MITVRAIRLTLCLLLISLLGLLRAATPEALYLTWYDDPCTTICVCWVTSVNQRDNGIEYREDKQKGWLSAEGFLQRLPDQFPYALHRIELKDLNPNTTYWFRLGADKNKTYKFRTLPDKLEDGSIRFIAGGDMYHGKDLHLLEEMNAQAAKTSPHFALLGGDIAYSGSKVWFFSEKPQRWMQWLKAWQEKMITQEGYLIPLIAAIGNHETNGRFDQTPAQAPFFYAFFCQTKHSYRVLDIGNYLSLFVLDSGHTHPIKGHQAHWLTESLRLRQDRPHKIALYHVPAFPSHGKFNFKQSRLIREHWVPAFEKYGLNFALENHCHTYKRTYPIIGSQVDLKGPVYIGDGCWGSKPRIPVTPSRAWFLVKSASKRHFILGEISSSQRLFKAIDIDGNIFDQFIVH